MINERTTYLNLPLPSPLNYILDDVVRLRDALVALDTAVNSKASAADLSAAIAAVVGGAPAVLDTIKELATAIGNDPTFSADILTQIAALQSSVSTLNASIGTKADASATQGYTIGDSTATGHLVRGNEIVKNNFTVSGNWELMPDAILTVLDIDTTTTAAGVFEVDTTITGNRLVVEQLFVRSSATLTVQDTVQIAGQKVFMFN
jgi:hypothetical protein